MKKIVLASASPRRRELMQKTGLSFEVDAANLDEKIDTTLSPAAVAETLSRQKAELVAERYTGALIIAADTIGVFRGEIVGKPGTPEVAVRMLQKLNGEMHQVITGFTLRDSDNERSITRSVITKVYLKELSRIEIEEYVQTGEPLDKAGAYAIQGLGAAIVERIEGDYDNVVGLPLAALVSCLKEFGVSVR